MACNYSVGLNEILKKQANAAACTYTMQSFTASANCFYRTMQRFCIFAYLKRYFDAIIYHKAAKWHLGNSVGKRYYVIHTIGSILSFMVIA